jgi:hypothetical protein
MNAPKTAGYSETPLAKKLGIKENSHVLLLNAPAGYDRLLQPFPASVVFDTRLTPGVDLVQVFATERDDLAKRLALLRRTLRPDASVWISWPKKASKVPTTITEDVIRELALPLGFVDVKVCAVSDVWSGLKLMVRKELR